MLRNNVLDYLYAKRKSPKEFNWDSLFAPSMYCYMSEYDIGRLYNVASSIKYAGDILKKEKAIKQIMEPLGFRRLASGTNRLVYSYLEDTSFVAKIAIDKAGMGNTPAEFNNQQYLKPFVVKCFECHPTGVIGIIERGLPITNLEEFISIWDDVFEVIINLIGEYILEDIGTDFFMNWLIRPNFGPVLCDYPEMFKLDGDKIFCNRPIIRGQKYPVCGATIDYDAGFNYLTCPKCGKQYKARELAEANKNKLIVMEGDIEMDVQLFRGNEVIVDGRDIGTDIIRKPKIKRSSELGVVIEKVGSTKDEPAPDMDATAKILEDMMKTPGGQVLASIADKVGENATQEEIMSAYAEAMKELENNSDTTIITAVQTPIPEVDPLPTEGLEEKLCSSDIMDEFSNNLEGAINNALESYSGGDESEDSTYHAEEDAAIMKEAYHKMKTLQADENPTYVKNVPNSKHKDNTNRVKPSLPGGMGNIEDF